MSSTEAKQESPDRKPSNDHQSTSKSESKFFSLLIETPPLKLRTADKYTGCNCRKSRCLKMYCICFAKGKMCDKVLPIIFRHASVIAVVTKQIICSDLKLSTKLL